MAKDNFLDWLREKILQNPQEPPADSWEEISDSLDLEESWNKIGEELEINTVWERIDSRLVRYGRLRKFEHVSSAISVAAGVLLLFSLFWSRPLAKDGAFPSVLTIHSDKWVEEEKQPIVTDTSFFPGKNRSTEAQLQQRKSTIKNQNNFPDAGIYSLEKNIKPSPVASNAIVESSGGITGGKEKQFVDVQTVLFAKGIPVVAELDVEEEKLTIPELVPFMVPASPVVHEKSSYPSSYAGVGTNIKMSWLLNNKTYQAMEKGSLLTAAPNFQQDYYLLYGFRLKPRLLIQSDVYLKNVVGQEYKEYREGRFGKVEDRLEYQSVGLVASYLNGQISYGTFPTYSRWLAGVYGGRLTEAQEITQWEKNSKREEFKQHHLGLVAGYEHDTFLEERLIFTYGIRSRADLFNIYSGTESFSSTFKRTRAISLDFSISLKYVLKK